MQERSGRTTNISWTGEYPRAWRQLHGRGRRALAGARPRPGAGRRAGLSDVDPELREPLLSSGRIGSGPPSVAIGSPRPARGEPQPAAAAGAAVRAPHPGAEGRAERARLCGQAGGRAGAQARLLYIHGGGYIAGRGRPQNLRPAGLARDHGIFGVSVDYRLVAGDRLPGLAGGQLRGAEVAVGGRPEQAVKTRDGRRFW